MMALWGPAAKPGDLARISNIVIKDDYIPLKSTVGPSRSRNGISASRSRARVEVTPIAPSDQNANARGSFVDLLL